MMEIKLTLLIHSPPKKGNYLALSSGGKESACNMGDLGLIPGLGRFPGGGHGNPPTE